MKRRSLLLLPAGVVLAPLAARAQRDGRAARIGVLRTIERNDAFFQAFLNRLSALGHVEGKTFVLYYVRAPAHDLDSAAAELVQRGAHLIFAPNPQTAIAARRATQTIPIVFAVVGDPVRAGLVKSLARPGGNATGLTAFGSDLGGKRLELLRELSPAITRVGVLWNSSVPDKQAEWENTQQSAREMGLQLVSLEVKAVADVPAALELAQESRVNALVVFPEPVTFISRRESIRYADRARIPAVFAWREAVVDGGLLAFGPSIADNYRRAAEYVDRILRGAKPADLPVAQPTQLELFINLKTAKALGLKIPQSVMVLANELIE